MAKFDEHTKGAQLTQFQFDDYEFDTSDGCLRNQASGAAVTLRPQVGKLLQCLLERQGQVVNRETVCLAIWGEGVVVDFESGLAAVVKELRQSLLSVGASTMLLETVPRRGYRLKTDENRTAQFVGRADRMARAGRILPLAIVLAAALIVWMVWVYKAGVAESNSPSLVILPFERYGEIEFAPEHVEYLIADRLLALLWQAELEGLVLIGRSSVRAFADSDNVAAAVAEELSADLILEGDLISEPNGWRVEARLLKLPDGRVIWSASHRMNSQQNPSIDQATSALIQDLEQHWSEKKGDQ